MLLTFEKEMEEPLGPLKQAVMGGTLGNIRVNPDSVIAVDISGRPLLVIF